MITTETMTIDGREFVRTYSDAGYYIQSESGERYSDAVDPADSGRTYTETDELVPVKNESTEPPMMQGRFGARAR